jgi:hypothetical protein
MLIAPQSRDIDLRIHEPPPVKRFAAVIAVQLCDATAQVPKGMSLAFDVLNSQSAWQIASRCG